MERCVLVSTEDKELILNNRAAEGPPKRLLS